MRKRRLNILFVIDVCDVSRRSAIAHHPCRNPDSHRKRPDRPSDHSVRTDRRIVANLDGSENFCSRSDINSISDYWAAEPITTRSKSNGDALRQVAVAPKLDLRVDDDPAVVPNIKARTELRLWRKRNTKPNRHAPQPPRHELLQSEPRAGKTINGIPQAVPKRIPKSRRARVMHEKASDRRSVLVAPEIRMHKKATPPHTKPPSVIDAKKRITTGHVTHRVNALTMIDGRREFQ